MSPMMRGFKGSGHPESSAEGFGPQAEDSSLSAFAENHACLTTGRCMRVDECASASAPVLRSSSATEDGDVTAKR
ncbi:MAG: hypothetical protein ABIG11_08890 [bacterium]